MRDEDLKEQVIDLIDSKFDFGSQVSDAFYDNVISDHKDTVANLIEEKGIDNISDAKEFVNEYIKNEFADEMNSFVENGKRAEFDSAEFTDALNAVATGAVDSDVKQNFEWDVSNAIEKEIIYSMETEGMSFDNKFSDFISEDFGLNNASLVDDAISQGIEQVLEDQKNAFKNDSGFENSEFAVEIATYTVSEDVLNKLSDSGGDDVLKAVAENDKTNAGTLENIVANTDNTDVLEAVAKHENTASYTLDEIVANTDNKDVLVAVAGNENTNIDTLENLASNDNKEVRDAVIDNSNSSEKAKDIAEKINEISSSIKTEDTNTEKAASSLKM